MVLITGKRIGNNAFPEFVRVIQEDWDTPSADVWVEQLHREIMSSTTPAILIAHSLACCLVARWALAHSGPVAAAFLVAPSDVEAPNYPSGTTGFSPMHLRKLPFKSLVVVSSDDEYAPPPRGKQFAEAWGSICFAWCSRPYWQCCKARNVAKRSGFAE